MHIEIFVLKDKKALVIGIANEHSIASGCAKAFKSLGADSAISYLNDKAKPYVEPLARELEASIFMPCDVRKDGELEEEFAEISRRWGKLDIALHSIAFGPKEDLQRRLVDSSLRGFLAAVDVLCHSFVRVARLSESLMKEGGTLFTMSYYGVQMVAEHYNLMGPVKAALEATGRYLAAELGPRTRLNAISPGSIQTRAASGLSHFDELLSIAAGKALAKALATIDDVGNTTATLACEAGTFITGQTIYVDGGYHIMD